MADDAPPATMLPPTDSAPIPAADAPPPPSSPAALIPPPPTDSAAPTTADAPETKSPILTAAQPYPRPPTINRYTRKRTRKGARKPTEEEDGFLLDPVKPGLLLEDANPPSDSAPIPDASPPSSPAAFLPPPTDSAPETKLLSPTAAQRYPRPPTIHRYTKRTGRKGGRKPKHQPGASSSSNPNAAEEDEFLLEPVKPGLLEDDGPELPVLLSHFHKERRVKLSHDRLTAGSSNGYRMARATRGVASGAWYFEVRVLHLGPTSAARLGWAAAKALLVAPVGNDAFGFGYRSVDGSKVTGAWRSDYGDAYETGDVLGFYISLPQGELYEPPNDAEMVKYRGLYFFAKPVPKDNTAEKPAPVPVPGSEIVYFKNGVCQGTAFDNIPGGRYYPAASMYTMPDEPKCVVKFNFGPDFMCFPEDFGGRPVPRPMSEVPYQPYVLMNEGAAKNSNAEKAA